VTTKTSGMAKRVNRLIARLLFFPRPKAYGGGFWLSGGFLLDPKIPKILSRSPVFFSASALAGAGSWGSPGAAGLAPGLFGWTGPGWFSADDGGGGGLPPFPKRWA